MAAGASNAIFPLSLIPGSMQYGKNHHVLLNLILCVDDSIRKAPWVAPSNVLFAMSSRVKKRIVGEFWKDASDFRDELLPQSFTLPVIPSRCLIDVQTRLRANRYGPAHKP
jgi:hypothetical protein